MLHNEYLKANKQINKYLVLLKMQKNTKKKKCLYAAKSLKTDVLRAHHSISEY
jgi:hypothetical protein